jgi:hypothetical protein
MSTLPGQRADMQYFIVCGGLPAAEALTFVRLAQGPVGVSASS